MFLLIMLCNFTAKDTIMRIIEYKFDIRELLDDVTGRTSVIAAHSATPEQPDRLDELTLTAGEWLTFKGLLDKACADMYSFMAPFSRNLRKGYEVGQSIFDSVAFYHEEKEWFNTNKIPEIRTNIKEALVNHIIARWYVSVLPDLAPQYWTNYEEAAELVKSGLNSERRIQQLGYNWF